MKLIVNSKDAGSPVIPVRWCITQEDLQHLKQEKEKNQYILLAIINNGRDVDRQLLPLNQMLTFITFSRPGKTRIAACIVSSPTGIRKLKKLYLSKTWHGGYESNILEGDRLAVGYAQTGITVQVAREFFAKETAGWEKFWVNLWFETYPRDQCQFRRRRILAYTIQPPLVLLWVIAKTLVRFCAAFLWTFILAQREVGWKAVIHPFRYDNDDVWDHAKRAYNFFAENKNGKERQLIVQVCVPVLTIIVFGVLELLNFVFKIYAPWYYLLVASPFVAPGIVALVEFGFWAVSMIDALLERVWWPRKVKVPKPIDEKKLAKRRQKEAEQQRKAELAQATRLQELEKSYAVVACDGPVVPRLDALPREKQTIYLRYLDLKAKVCKPFAR